MHHFVGPGLHCAPPTCIVVDNEHANQGSRCSSAPTYALVVHNVAFYRLGGAQDDFACLLSNFFYGVPCSVVSLSGLINYIINWGGEGQPGNPIGSELVFTL